MDEIWLHVALDNITAADAVLDEFERTCRLLSLQPNMGRIREELAENLRSFPVGRYLVFYRFFEDLRAITTYLVFSTWAELIEILRSGRVYAQPSTQRR